jgi:general secretion pathway protein G
MMSAAIVTLFLVMYVFRYDDGGGKSGYAKAGITTLTTAVKMYKTKFGENPAQLKDLLEPPDGPPIVEPSGILDPWGRPYQYDPTGPRNQGKQPDIWTVGHDRQLIGNWPERHWWD